MKSAVRPVKSDHRRFSYHRTFLPLAGALTEDFDLDAGLSNPDENALGLDQACTGITQTEIAQDENKKLYDFRYTYDKTLEIEGIFPNDPAFEKVGCDVEDSLKSTIIYGLKGTDGGDPTLNKRGPYYDALDNSQGLDAFDAAIATMRAEQKSLSIVAQFLKEWLATPYTGIVTSVYLPDPNAPWHNFKICGVKTIEGEVSLKAKPWLGPQWADKGYCYFSRDVFNKAMANKSLLSGGAAAFVQAPYTGQIQAVEIVFVETIISYIRLLLKKLSGGFKRAGSTTPCPSPTSMLDVFCTGIRDFEGSPGDLNYQNNNPGNCRCSPTGYLPKYGNVICVNDFAKFPTYALGWEYLRNLVLYRVKAHSQWTFLDFFMVYSPPADNNPTEQYAEFVAKRCGVPVSTVLSQLLT